MIWPWAALILASPLALYALALAWTHRKYRGVPGPKRSSFFTGHLNEILEAKKHGRVTSQLLLEWHLEYGYTIVVFILHKVLVSCCDPEIIKDVLLQHPRTFPKALFYDKFGFVLGGRGLGRGLITERDYDKWAKQRQVLNPAFHKRYIVTMVGDLNVMTDEFIHVLGVVCAKGEPVELTSHIHSLTLDVIAKVGFGVQTGVLHGESELPVALRGIVAGLQASLTSAFPNWSPLMYGERKKYQKHLKLVKSVASRQVAERFQMVRNGETMPADILSIMISAHMEDPEFSEDLIMDNMITLYLAGQETTANTLGFVFMELGRHPEVLNKVIEEVERRIGDKHFISYEDISSLEYCGMVIKETLRMYSVAPATIRYIPFTKTYKNVCLPGGTDVTFTSYGSQNHPGLVNEPDRFDPERFSAGSDNRISNVSYFPFSLGPRTCAGKHFAMTELKLILAKFFQKFRFTLDPCQSSALTQFATLRLLHGVTITLHER